MKRIEIEAFGGPEAMRLIERPTPSPGPGEARVRIEAPGVNYIDTYQRSGLYPRPLPAALGLEGAGTVEAAGEGASVRVGQRVAWKDHAGSYATHAAIPAEKLVEVPDGVSAEQAAAVMLQGMTAHYLSHSTHELRAGETCLVHAAAGGVGLLLCQLAKLRGARVLGTTSSEEKAALAKEAGADEVILYTREDFAAAARRLTGGEGVHVVYDGVGKDTFLKGLDALRVRGLMVLFGGASGPVAPLDLQVLNAKGALYVTRPALAQYTRTREEYQGRARDLFGWLAAGRLQLRIGATYPLADAARAHQDLQGRRTTGKLLLLP